MNTTDDTEVADADLVRRWERLYSEPANGWDFTEFEGRVVESEPPWSYERLAREALTDAASAVDLGTGGGEFLLSISDALPSEMHATEGWPPNLPVAQAALEPLGVPVADYDADRGDRLPFNDASFDVVLSRHEAYSAAEVHRVLRRGGTFLTQQVDGHNLADLAAVFGGGPAYPDITLPALRAEADAAGLIVTRADEWHGPIRFADVDTLVSYLRMMPWQLPGDFTIDHHAGELLRLHRRNQPLEFTEARFLLVACRSP